MIRDVVHQVVNEKPRCRARGKIVAKGDIMPEGELFGALCTVCFPGG